MSSRPNLQFESSDISDVLRDEVERAQAKFDQVCAPGTSKEMKQAAVTELQRSVLRLNDYILRHIIPTS